MTIVADTPAPVDVLGVTLGIDTHADSHVAAVIDPLGRHLGQAAFDPTVAGFKALLAWAAEFGTITLAGVEGTGSFSVHAPRGRVRAGGAPRARRDRAGRGRAAGRDRR